MQRGPISCAELLRSIDWSTTKLGPRAAWPRTLEGYLAMVMEMPTPAIIFWGPDQAQLYNDGYAVIMGPRHPTYFGAPYRECWPDTYPVIHPWMQAVLAGDVKQVERNLFMLTRHGFNEESYFTFTFSPLRDDDGAIAGILQPVVEVTDAVLGDRRSETLRALAPRADADDVVAEAFAALAGNAKDVPFALYYAWDDAARRLALVADTSPGAFDPAALARAAERLGAVCTTGKPTRIDDVAALLGAHPPSVWGDATRGAVALPVPRGSSEAARGVLVLGTSPCLRFDARYAAFFDAVAGSLAASLDAQQSRNAERERRRRLQAVFMQAPVAVTILRGREYVVDLANPLMCRIWGRPPEQVLDRPLFAAMPDLARQGLEELLDEVRTTGVPYVGRERLTRIARLEGGGLDDVIFNFVYEPMRDDAGHIEAVIVVAADVTVQVRARQRSERLAAELQQSERAADEARAAAESANRAKDEFLAMLGHELRNPLAPILTAIELMRLRDDGDALARERAIIERQARHMTRLVDDLLDVSRITRGTIELKREPVELSEIVAKAIETASPLLEKLRHELVTDVAVRGLVVIADPARLVQVLANLINNAAKYTDAGGRIVVAAARQGDEIVVTVSDSGRGISTEMLPRVFGLFVQERQNLDRSEGGLGLGLAIVKSLVELHGGRVQAHSGGHGCGSTFTVALPAAMPATTTVAPPAAEAGHQVAPPAARVGHSVLIVDDNDDAAELLAIALDALGFATRIAGDGVQALAVAAEARFDAVLLDIGLPVMDGYEVARRLRTLPGWERTRLIAITGYGQESDRQRSQEAGFDQHLVKPVDVATLRAALRDLAGG